MCKLDLPSNNNAVSIDIIKKIIDEKTYRTEYQPFICIKNNNVFAYEALARFEYNNIKFRPDYVLQTCHDDIELFSKLELLLKEYQFKNRPNNGSKLFVNFDLHSISEKDQVNKFMEFFSLQNNFVIELVENSYQKINTQKLVEVFRKFEFEFAVDDFFKEDSSLSIFLLNHCDYLKLDKDILHQLKSNKYFFHIVKGIVDFVHSQEKKIIIEGVETTEELDIARNLNIDIAQGFLFKEKFISA